MNTNIETAIMSLIGSDPRFQRAMAMMQGKTPSLPMCGAWIEIRQVRINHMPHYSLSFSSG